MSKPKPLNLSGFQKRAPSHSSLVEATEAPLPPGAAALRGSALKKSESMTEMVDKLLSKETKVCAVLVPSFNGHR